MRYKLNKYLAVLILFCACANANDAANLALKRGCTACHAMDKKVLGPSLSQIAAKYKDHPNYLPLLVNKVKNGGSGVWGVMPMPPHKNISDEDISTIVTWIVTDVEPSTAPLPTTAEVNAVVAKSKAKIDKDMEGLRNARREYEASKRNYENAIRNPPAAQARTQTRTQTSQNNSPSSSSDNDSYSTSNSQTSSTNSKRLDNPAALVNECISIKSGGGGLKNNCGFTVYYSYCTLNGINNPINKCEQNELGTAGMGSYKDDGYSGLAGDKINWFACKAPSMPKQTNYDSQHGVITGYCSN